MVDIRFYWEYKNRYIEHIYINIIIDTYKDEGLNDLIRKAQPSHKFILEVSYSRHLN